MCRLEALKRDSGTDVEVAIDPEELEGLDEAQVKALYEQRLSEERARHSREVQAVNTVLYSHVLPEVSLNSNPQVLSSRAEKPGILGKSAFSS